MSVAPGVEVTSSNSTNPVLSPPGFIPFSDVEVVQSIRILNIIEGGGEGGAPSITLMVDLATDIIPDVDEVTVTLSGPNGNLVTADADLSQEFVTVQLPEFAVSGTYTIQRIQIDFVGPPEETGLPASNLTLEADEISSLSETRFIDIVNPGEDITPPSLSDIELPNRTIQIDNDLPSFLGGGDNSVEITFQGNFSDDQSGLNVIEFEFDIGDGFPAVIGAEIGLLGDLDNGVRQLSTVNTEAPTGNFIFELLRVSDDNGNTQLLTADDLASLGFQNSVQVVSQADLQDATSPDVTSFTLSSQAVTIGAEGGTIDVTLNATDAGFDATGVQSVTLVLTNTLGSRYQLDAQVTFADGTDSGTASFLFARDFPAGEFTIERLSVNDAAFNRQDVTLENSQITVTNPFGGDVSDNRLVGDAADNVITARAGDDNVTGGDGSDLITLGDGNDTSFAGAGDTGDDTVVGGSGDDLIGAAAGSDFIVGGQLITLDPQTLLFRALEQRLDGADTIFGGVGDDSIFGGSPRITVNDEGEQFVDDFGSIAPNALLGGAGNDWIVGSFGADELFGGEGDDTLQGGVGDDIFFGGRGDQNSVGLNDVIVGGEGNDTLFASAGDDSISGGADNDEIFGGAGNDTISGDGGQDQIFGGVGDDTLSGGGGADIFFFQPGSGADFITDFEVNSDTLFLEQFASQLGSAAAIIENSMVTNMNGFNGLLIDLGGGDQIFLAGVTDATAVMVTI